MKHSFFFSALLCVLALLLTSCSIISFPEKGTPDTGRGILGDSTAEPTERKPSDPQALCGIWYSRQNLTVFDFSADGTLCVYGMQAGYYEYEQLWHGIYSYDGLTLSFTLDGYAEVTHPCSVDDVMTMENDGETMTFVRADTLPTEHPFYTFPDLESLANGMKIEIPECTGLTLQTDLYGYARYSVRSAYWKANQEGAQLLTEGTVRAGDFVSIDYAGYTGEKNYFEGGTGSSAVTYAADGYGFIDGFASGLVGHSVSEGKFTVAVTFPENYGSAELAGQNAFFEMTIKGIYPELTDDMVAAYAGTDFTTVEAWETSVFDSALSSQVMDLIPFKALDETTLPEETYAFFYQYNLDYFHQMAHYYCNDDLDLYLAYYAQTTLENLRKGCISIARNYLKHFLFAKKTGFVPDEADVARVKEELIASYVADGAARADVEAYFAKAPGSYEYRAAILLELLPSYLIAQNTFTEAKN